MSKEKLNLEESHYIGNFKIFMNKDGDLKITAIGDKKSDISIEPISANNIKIVAK